MILYHGSNTCLERPSLLKILRSLDFGKGFYATDDFELAKEWAQRISRVRAAGEPLVSCYEIQDSDVASLKILRFDTPDEKWLDFVASNIKNILEKTDWDLIVGPAATDKIYETVILYLDGFLDMDSCKKRLLPQKLKNQYAFKTEKALSCLKFIEVKKA